MRLNFVNTIKYQVELLPRLTILYEPDEIGNKIIAFEWLFWSLFLEF